MCDLIKSWVVGPSERKKEQKQRTTERNLGRERGSSFQKAVGLQ